MLSMTFKRMDLDLKIFSKEGKQEMPKGVIRRLIRERYAGIIKTERGEEISFNRNQLQEMSYDSSLVGKRVEFDVKLGANGHPEAIRIRSTGSRG